MIELILVIAIVGVVVWFITTLPMPVIFKNAIMVIAGICLLIYVAQFFGVVDWNFPRGR